MRTWQRCKGWKSMADYFETDTVTKEYDRRLAGRILAYLKPYRLLVVLTLAALLISTLGELCIPVLQQRIIDRYVLARFLEFDTDAFEREKTFISASALAAYNEMSQRKDRITIGPMIFVLQGGQTSMKGRIESELRERKVLQGDQWYAFTWQSDDDPVTGLIQSKPELFLTENKSFSHAAAIRSSDLYALPPAEIITVRRGDAAGLLGGGVLFLAILTAVFVFTFSQTWTSNLASQRVMKDIRLGLFKKTLSQSTAFLSRHPVGRIVTRLTGDVDTLDEFFTTVLAAFLKDLSIMAGTLVTLFILSRPLAFAVVLTMPPVLAVTLVSRIKARDAFRKQRTASSKVYAYLAERLAGMQVVQLFRQEKKSASEFASHSRDLLDANLGETYVFATFRPIVEWFSIFTVAVVIVVGSKMALSLSVSLGVLIAFINLVQMFYAPVTDIAEKYTLLQSAMAGGERIFKLLDTEELIPDEGKRAIGSTVQGQVEFDNVRFSYKNGEEVLKGLTFSVRPGEMAAIVGYTGAGKTTIINVLSRLWDIDSGEIRLDGVPVREIPLQELRRAVLPVLQDVFLFSGTVAENISMGLKLSEEQIIDAAKAVHAHEFISRLPAGYATVLSEGAANISSGQRQLISFARVIAHNPRVVILDEATSSIDTETEHLIQMGLQRLLAGRTSFVIAHRLSTIKHADRILVLSGGRLVEEGKHDALVARNGLYAGLYRLQYAEDI
jgi:ATP-binding cassette subfamily B protein